MDSARTGGGGGGGGGGVGLFCAVEATWLFCAVDVRPVERAVAAVATAGGPLGVISMAIGIVPISNSFPK